MADASLPHAPGRVPVAAGVAAGLVAFVLMGVHALVTPLMGLPDEPAHAVYATAVVRGEVVGDDVVRTDPESGWTRTETALVVPAAYAALPERPTCFAFAPDVPATCAPPIADVAGEPTTAVSTVGTYAPAWYALVGWPSLVLTPTPALYAMRGLAAAVAAALVGIAVVATLRVGAGRWGLVGVLAALTPVAAHLAGGLNPSGTEIAAAAALWATSAVMVLRPADRADVVRWGVAAVAVALSRPLGPALLVGVPLVVAWAIAGGAGLSWVCMPAARAAVVVAGGAGVTSVAWSLWRGTLSAFSGFPAPELGLGEVLGRSAGLMPERLVEMVGVVGWSDVGLPPALVLGWLVVVAGVVLGALRRAEPAARWWLLVLGGVVLVLPILADLRSASRIGFVWQGRYTLPVAAGLPVLGGIIAGRSWPGGHEARGLVGAGAGVLALVHGAFLLLAVQRFSVGTDGSIASAVGGHTTAGVPTWVVLAVAGVAFGVAVAGVATAERGGSTRGVTGESTPRG